MITKENFPILLAAFCGMFQQQQQERLKANGLDCQANMDNAKVTTKTGGKFVKVDIGSSGRFMVEIATGNIFGIKGYGVVHRGHCYGTLETVNEYNWGDYYPKRLDGKQRMQPGANSRIPALTFAPVMPDPLYDGIVDIVN